MSMPGAIVVGLTGGLACGKTAFLNSLEKSGAFVISTDSLAHEALEKGRPGYRAVLGRYGEKYLGPGRAVDRAELGRHVFSVTRARRWLEDAVHPWILKKMASLVRTCRRKVIVADVPLLFEKKLEDRFDLTVCVYSTWAQQVSRAMARNWTRKDVLERMKAQWSASEKARRADIVIDNTGKMNDLRRQADGFYAALKMIARSEKQCKLVPEQLK